MSSGCTPAKHALRAILVVPSGKPWMATVVSSFRAVQSFGEPIELLGNARGLAAPISRLHVQYPGPRLGPTLRRHTTCPIARIMSALYPRGQRGAQAIFSWWLASLAPPAFCRGTQKSRPPCHKAVVSGSGRVKLLTNHCWIQRRTRIRRTWETETRVSPDSRTLRLSLGPARAGAGVLGRVEEELC